MPRTPAGGLSSLRLSLDARLARLARTPLLFVATRRRSGGVAIRTRRKAGPCGSISPTRDARRRRPTDEPSVDRKTGRRFRGRAQALGSIVPSRGARGRTCVQSATSRARRRRAGAPASDSRPSRSASRVRCGRRGSRARNRTSSPHPARSSDRAPRDRRDPRRPRRQRCRRRGGERARPVRHAVLVGDDAHLVALRGEPLHRQQEILAGRP